MCVVSMVSDYYTKTWPERFPSNTEPWVSDPELRKMLKEVLEKLDLIDKKLNDVECNDPVKQKFLDAIKQVDTVGLK